jgi:hypothetical protein
MKQYSAAVSDLFRSNKQYREERVLIRKTPPPPAIPPGGLEATADVIRFIPEGVGIYEAKAYPSADFCFDLLETKLLAPHVGPAPPSQIAPQVQLSSGGTGASSDLETRIDQAVVERPAAPQSATALKVLLDKTQILASLQVQSTERDKAGVFIRMRSAIALVAASDWNEAGAQLALADFIRAGVTASQLGGGWQQKAGYQQLDGLWPLVASVHGKYLLVADDPVLIEAMLSNFNRKSDTKPAVFVAGFNHDRERENFARFSGVIDRPNLTQGNAPGMVRQPQFFAENLASLSSTLAGVSAENIVVRIEGDKILQTVIYEWSR